MSAVNVDSANDASVRRAALRCGWEIKWWSRGESNLWLSHRRLHQGIALDPNFAEAYTNRANAYCRKGEVDRAIADSTQAIALDPKCALAYLNRGAAYGNKGDKEQAIADFRKALEIDPSDQDAKDGLKRLSVTP